MKTKPRKEALFVLLKASEDSVEFHDATAHIGKMMPFKKPKGVCAMRVTADTVAFSLSIPSKDNEAKLVGEELKLPHGILRGLEGKALQLAGSLKENEMLVEYEPLVRKTDKVPVEPVVVEKYIQKCKIIKDENNVAKIEPIDKDVSFELPGGPIRLSIYFKNGTSRITAVSFTGHTGKHRSTDTLRRAAGWALFPLIQLLQFRIVTDIKSIKKPAALRSEITAATVKRKEKDKVKIEIPVWLFGEGETPELLCSGNVLVEVELDAVDPAGSTTVSSAHVLLYHFTPSKEIAEHFEAYKAVLKSTIIEFICQSLEEDTIRGLVLAIAIGDFDTIMADSLRDALKPLSDGLDLTPQLYQKHV